MPFKSESLKITGKPDLSGFAQIYEYIPEFSETLLQKGHMFVFLANEDFENRQDNLSLSKHFFTKFIEKYYKESLIKPLDGLKKSLESSIKENIYAENYQLGIVCVLKNLVYILSVNGPEIYLSRKGTLTKLLDTSLKPVSASGQIQDNDCLMVVSSTFFNVFSKGVVKAALQSENFESLSGYVLPNIHSQEGLGKMGILAVRLKNDPDYLNNHNNQNQPAVIQEKSRDDNDALSLSSPAVGPFEFKNIQKNIKESVKKAFGKHFYSYSDIVSEKEIKKKKLTASLGLILMTLLVVSIVFGIQKKKETDYKRSYESDIATAKHNFEEAASLYTLNSARARELFIEGQKKVEELSKNKISDPELTKLNDYVRENEGKILGDYRQTPQVFIDLGLLSEGFKGDQIILSGGNINVLDKNGRTATVTSISNKRSEVVAGPSKVESDSQIVGYSDKLYTINDDGLYQIDGIKKKVLDKSWNGELLSYMFAGNLYVLEKESSIIWRYAGDDGKFGTARKWLAEDVSVNMADSKRWVIDGSIWILTGDNKINKFTSGNKQNFTLPSEFSGNLNPESIFVSDETLGIYILEKESGKVLVFTKEGEYVATYSDELIKNFSDIVVSEKDKKIILLNNDKLYSIEIKHLD